MKKLILILLTLISILTYGQDNKIYKKVNGNYIVIGAFNDVGSLWSDRWIVFQKKGSSFVEFGKVEGNNIYIKRGNSYIKTMENVDKDGRSFIIKTDENSQRLIGKWKMGIIYAKTDDGDWFSGVTWTEVGKVDSYTWGANLCASLILLSQY